MRPILLIVAALIAGCQDDAPTSPREPAAGKIGASAPAPALAALPGFYSGSDRPADQLCVHEVEGSLRFGLVAHSASVQSCSGTGTLARRGAVVRFEMGGDSPCVFNARVEGQALVLPASVPVGCAYYCGGGVSLAGRRLNLVEAGDAAAAKAKDLVGEPLCHIEPAG